MSIFDPAVFLSAQQNEANEKRAALPVENPEDASGLYTALVGEVTVNSGTIGKGDKAGQPWVSMLVPLKVQIPEALRVLGFGAELTITDRVFLDLTASGSIDNGKGKNTRQRNYREATGCNVAGVPFSWNMISGKVVKVKVSHELYNDAIQERIAQVLPS